MGLGTLREKQLVKYLGRIHRLDTLLSNGQWILTDLDRGLCDQRAENELWSALERGELVFVSGATGEPRESLPPIYHALSEAAAVGPAKSVVEDTAGESGALRLRYVKAIKGESKESAISAIQALWEELKWPVGKKPPGYSSVMRWKKAVNGHPDPVRALSDKHARKGRRGPRYDADVTDLLREVRDEYFLCSNPRRSIKSVTVIAQDKIRLINKARPKSEHLAIPGRKAMKAVIDELDAAEVLAARFGADKAMAMLRVSLGGVKTSRPLERVEIDHTILSIILVDDEDLEPIGRAFFTGAKDAHTRVVLGIYWGAENPSVVAVARCIRHSVLPKGEFLKAYPDVKNDWPCFGAAESWVLDNGLEEHALAVHQAASEGGVQRVEFSARVSPWQKPNIERYMRQQDQDFIHNLPGTTMENIARRTDFDPKKDVVMRWSTFGRLLIKWIVDIYMQKPQRILHNQSPYKKWIACKGEFSQFVPDRTTVLDSLFLRQVNERSLDHEGIEFDCLIYNSMDMKVIRNKFGPRLKVDIRVNDEDLSFIWVRVPEHEIWVKVPCLDEEYVAGGLTRWQHEKCKRVRKSLSDEGLELSLAESRLYILCEIDAEKKALKQGRRKARARMKEKDPGRGLGPKTNVQEGARCKFHNSREADSPDCFADEPVQFVVETLKRL